jgi:hypothetical protein
LLAQTLYQGNPDMYHRIWNIVSTERYAGAAGMLLHINGKLTMGKYQFFDSIIPKKLIIFGTFAYLFLIYKYISILLKIWTI